MSRNGPDSETVQDKIIASVFSRRNAQGALEESYISHVKIWEDAGPEGGGRKPRYILLSQASNGNGFLHKSKLNTNGSFSVGKTWRLPELHGLQVVNPLSFNITLSRTYRWQTENPADQSQFLEALIRLFRIVSPDSTLKLEGVDDVPRTGRPPVQNGTPRRPANNERAGTPSQSENDYDRMSSPPPRSQSRNGNGLPSRPASPATSSRGYPSGRAGARPGPGPPSSSSPQPSSRIRAAPRPSNAPSASGQIPSINLQATTSRPVPPDERNSSDGLAISRASISPASAYPSPAAPKAPSPLPRTTKRAGTIGAPADGRNARVSFFDPANQVALDRLITGASNDPDGEEETAQAMMSSVEEMIEGYEWAIDDVIGRKSAGGAADLIEARLVDELMALDKANIHSFLESDDLIDVVLKYMDEAISELDNMDSLVSSYKIHLNAVGDDISYIQSQNRGLQVQTQNQRALLAELENLLQTVQVDKEALAILTQESLEKSAGIQRLEEAATELYKALQAGQDTDMAATMERLQEYRTHNAQFCKRIFDFLSIMFTAQSQMLLGNTDGLSKEGRGRPNIIMHEDMEQYLGRYAGLMLYLKELDEKVYGKLCAAYFSAASELHSAQIKALLSAYINLVRKAADEDQDQGFGPTPTLGAYSKGATGMRRAGTLMRSPMEARNKDKDKSDGSLRASEVFVLILEQIALLIYREDEFIADFLQINDAALTFADYMNLDNYFRRQASRSVGLSQPTMKLVRGAMELIFGFLPEELKTWLDNAVAKDNMQIIGLLACIERFIAEADERGNMFLLNALGKQQMRLKGLFDRHINEQIKGVEQTKLTSKKRKGVAHFVKHFPIYIGLVESQLIGADSLEIRATVDAAYDRIVQSMFESLKQMAKLDGEGEDKGQLNFHVILIENMHHFVAETSQIEIGSVANFLRKAEAIYDENLGAYVKIVLRRPFGKLIDYFEGVERLLKTTAPSEVSTNASYNKSALKKVVKEYNAKDLRKHVDALFKRVEKHFTEASEKTTTEESGGIAPGTVMVGVWKACEEELLRITELVTKRISQCYADSGVTLDYTASDVEATFRRQRVGF
ncbi:exocyst complex component Sec3-domain-containing protein [Mycena maculata]|uniref:Exocyst complex component Sec3-domain-containing protein n=1 Tax=Mycena maculata TaxID=230809 RepID=A0AAD7P0P9_9AGAR|nr:exocyst complex component Sec3-domain-containing protein [Mycena maculata]